MGQLLEAVHNGQNGHIPFGRWKAADKIQGDIGTRTMWNRDRLL